MIHRHLWRSAGVLSTALIVIVAAATADRSRTRVVERYSNGTVRREATYRSGVLDGVLRGWYENGQQEYARRYTRGLETGTHRGWYDSGQPMFVYHYRHGVSEGLQQQWYRNGSPLTAFHHRAGHEVGQQQMWNPDGTIRSNYVVTNGRRYGLLGTMGCTGEGKPGDRAM